MAEQRIHYARFREEVYGMSGYSDPIFISAWFWLPYAVYFAVMLVRKVRIRAQEPVPDMV